MTLIGSDQSIAAGSKVRLHFSLHLEDGSLIDGTAVDQPASLEIGDGNLLPGFEACLFGLRAGDERSFELPPDEAFGEHQDGNLRRLARSSFGELDTPLEPGLMLSFASPEGELPGVVRELVGEQVVIDFNHPLAGRTIRFDVTIVEVENTPADKSLN
ncbi:MAG: peptidylprolyl isomerase [Pseudomonadota bacterium]